MNNKKSEKFTVGFLSILIIALMVVFLTRCTIESSTVTCTGVYIRIESNANEADLKRQGLDNRYPEMSVISDEFLSPNCDQYEPLVTNAGFMIGGLGVQEKTIIYKPY